MENKPKLVKVTMEYDDGPAVYLDGVDLEKWVKANKALASMSWVHGGRSGYEDIEWKKVKK